MNTPQPLMGNHTATRHVIDLANRTPAQKQGLLSHLIIPRPIAMITTVAEDGSINVAPYSYYMPVCGEPPTIAVTIGSLREATDAPKDTWVNIERTGEFVVNVTGRAMADHIEAVAREYPNEVSELDITGWTTTDSQVVSVPSLVDSPANLECRVLDVIDRGEPTVRFSGVHIVLAEVVSITVAEAILAEPDRIDPTLVSPIGRMGFPHFVQADSDALFYQERISYADITSAPNS